MYDAFYKVCESLFLLNIYIDQNKFTKKTIKIMHTRKKRLIFNKKKK